MLRMGQEGFINAGGCAGPLDPIDEAHTEEWLNIPPSVR